MGVRGQMTLLLGGLALGACVQPPDAVDRTVKIQAQGTLVMNSSDGAGWRGSAVLLVRETPEGVTNFQIKDARYSVLYAGGELQSTLRQGERETSRLNSDVGPSRVNVTRSERLVVAVESLSHLHSQNLGLVSNRLHGQLTSIGNRWANYRLGMLTTGRESEIQLSMRESADVESAGFSFTGVTSATDERRAVRDTYALGTGGLATLTHTGSHAYLMMGDRARFMIDLPERMGSVWRPGSTQGWREEFVFDMAHPRTGAAEDFEQMFTATQAGEGQVEIRNHLAARLIVGSHRVDFGMPGEVVLSGIAMIEFNLHLVIAANQISVSGDKHFTVEVESSDGAGSSRADLPTTPVVWPVIEW